MRHLLIALCLASLAAGEAQTFPEPFDPKARLDDAALMLAPAVSEFVDGAIAPQVGVRIGDRVVAVDGRRVIGEGEYDLVRLGLDGEREDADLDLVRDGTVVHVHSDRTLPVRRLGFSTRLDYRPIYAELARWGVADDGETGASRLAWRRFPARPLAAVLRWAKAHDPARDGHAWIGDVDRLFRALRDQEWAVAAAQPEPKPPTPEMVELVRFWRALAKAQAARDEAPDPSRANVPLEWFVAHYPYPRLIPPPLGKLAESGLDGADAMARAREREASGLAPLTLEQAGFAQVGGPVEDWWTNSLVAAMIDSDRHGGWPFRHAALYDDGQRARILERMAALAAENRPDAPFYRFAAILPEIHRVIAAGGDDAAIGAAIDHAFAELVAVRDWSPYLAHKGAQWLVRTVAWRDLNDQAELVRAGAAQLALPYTTNPSRLLAHLAERCADSYFTVLEPPGEFELHRVWLALRQRPTTAQVAADLAALADSPDLPRRRAEAMALGRDAFKDACGSTPTRLITGLVKDHHGYGQLTDTCERLLTWAHARPFDGGPAWWPMLAMLDEHGGDIAWPAMREGIAALPKPGPTLHAAVAAAADDAGTPASLLLLARACDRCGDVDDAAVLRGRAKRFLDALTGFARVSKLRWSTRRDIALAAAEWRHGDPIAAVDAIADLDLVKQWTKDGDIGNEWHLLAARAHLALGDRARAVDELCASFERDTDEAKVFLVGDDDPFIASPPFRSWLVGRLAPDLDGDERKRIAAAAKPALVDAAFAARLGVEAKAVGGGGGAQANDF